MFGARRHKRILGWIAIIALLSNVLASPSLVPSMAASLVDDVLGPLVICTADGAQAAPGHGGSGGHAPANHCPACVTVAQFVLAVAIILTAIAFLASAGGQADATAVALARRAPEPRWRPQPRSTFLCLNDSMYRARPVVRAQVRFSAETIHVSQICKLRGLGRAHPRLTRLCPSSLRRRLDGWRRPYRHDLGQHAGAGPQRRCRRLRDGQDQPLQRRRSSRPLRASTSTPTASTPSWRRPSSMPTA